MRYLGLGAATSASFAALSEGEQRLVLMARALVKHPSLLVLDEPCQGLDGHNHSRILQVVEAVGTHLDTSVIYVTHDTKQLPGIITHTLYLDRGQVKSQRRTSDNGPSLGRS